MLVSEGFGLGFDSQYTVGWFLSCVLEKWLCMSRTWLLNIALLCVYVCFMQFDFESKTLCCIQHGTRTKKHAFSEILSFESEVSYVALSYSSMGYTSLFWPLCRMDWGSSLTLMLRLSMRWMLTLLMKRTRYMYYLDFHHPLLSLSSYLLFFFHLFHCSSAFCFYFLLLLIENYYSLQFFCVFMLWKCSSAITCTVT